jgi:2-dehydropantoate 2-reductase
MKWSKVVANLVGNATSGVLDMDPAAIYTDPGLFEVERDQLKEALAVMRARGLKPVSLPGTPVPLLAFAVTLPAVLARTSLGLVVGSARGGKDPSLRGAIKGGPPTEAGWLNGAVVRAGASLAVPTPVNEALARLADEAAADPDRRAWFQHRPDRLLEALGR